MVDHWKSIQVKKEFSNKIIKFIFKVNIPFIFSIELWAVIIVVMIIFTFLYTTMELIIEKRSNGFINCFRVAIGTSIEKLPQSNLIRFYLVNKKVKQKKIN